MYRNMSYGEWSLHYKENEESIVGVIVSLVIVAGFLIKMVSVFL